MYPWNQKKNQPAQQQTTSLTAKTVGFTPPPNQVKKIHDKVSKKNIGISLWTDNALQEVRKNSGVLAKANEFQTHYWSLNFRKKFEDGSIIDISIPTVFFNYKQQVNVAHIDFELSDVETMSDALLPVHNTQVAILLPLIEEHFESFEAVSVNLNSMHRHPGGRQQGFSGTDLKQDHEVDTGVVFPLASGEEKANFASIMCIQNGKTYLAHSEYRIADGAVPDKEGLTYLQGRCSSYVKADPTITQVSAAEAIVEIKTKYTDNYLVQDKWEDSSEFEECIYEIWDNTNYEPSTEFISAENVSQKVHTQKVNYGYEYGQSIAQQTVAKVPTKAKKLFMQPNERSLVISALLLDDSITIHPLAVLRQMDPNQRNEHMAHLEEYYYCVTGATITTILTDDEITELQDDIVEEKYEELLETKQSGI